MKTLSRILFLALGSLMMLPASAGNISGSAHDFTTQSWSGGRICVACHAPHKTDTTINDAPLWNHTTSAAAYTMYSSPTLNAVIGQPNGNSLLCLSCHDGTVAVDSFGGMAGGTNISTENNLTTNLKASHPIGFVYDNTLAGNDGSLHNPTSKQATIGSGGQTKSGSINDVLLYGGKMECESCHDVHNTFTVGGAGTGLLKMSQAGGVACLTCHNK